MGPLGDPRAPSGPLGDPGALRAPGAPGCMVPPIVTRDVIAVGVGAAGSIVVGVDDLDVGHDAVMLLTM